MVNQNVLIYGPGSGLVFSWVSQNISIISFMLGWHELEVSWLLFLLRPEPHGRGGGSQQGQADAQLPEQDEEILGSDDDEQEDPNDYCRGEPPSGRETFESGKEEYFSKKSIQIPFIDGN